MQTFLRGAFSGVGAVALLALASCSSVEQKPEKLLPPAAAKIAPYAMLAANAYHHKGARFPVEDIGWKQVDLDLEEIPLETPRPTYAHRFSLAYDIFRSDRRHEYAFVFRGTDSVLDFPWANLAILISPQYQLAHQEFKEFLRKKEAHARTRRYTVTLAGHSLGAGLGIGNSVRYGLKAVAFDPSPRLFSLPARKFCPAERTVVFQKGEILTFFRRPTSAWYLATKQGKVYETTYDFSLKPNAISLSKWVGLHSMAKLATGIVGAGAKVNKELEPFSLGPR